MHVIYSSFWISAYDTPSLPLLYTLAYVHYPFLTRLMHLHNVMWPCINVMWPLTVDRSSLAWKRQWTISNRSTPGFKGCCHGYSPSGCSICGRPSRKQHLQWSECKAAALDSRHIYMQWFAWQLSSPAVWWVVAMIEVYTCIYITTCIKHLWVT